MRFITCVSRIPVVDKQEWVFGYGYIYRSSFSDKEQQKHRVPSWATLQLHLTLEEITEDIYSLLFGRFSPHFNCIKLLLLPYDIIHGVICAYSMRSILNFWRARK
jgi:hypothetical protein